MIAPATILRILATAAFVTLTVTGTAAQQAEIPVDLELVLAADASASIDSDEANLQRAGYLSALADPRVVNAVRTGMLGRIAVTYVEWAGSQETVVDWTLIQDTQSALAFAAALRAAPLNKGATTSLSGALDFASALFDNNGFAGTRRVIDISSDGRNHSGRPLFMARDDTLALGITINALPVLHLDANGKMINPGLDLYYRERVIGGPGAFMIPALGDNAFPEAILRKLIIEIAEIDVPSLPRYPDLAFAVQHIDTAGDDDRRAKQGERVGEVTE